MELALVIRELLGRKLLLALGLLVALAVAALSVNRIDGFGLAPKSLQYSAATTQVFLDTHETVLGNVNPAVTELTTVATLDANFMTSPAVLNVIGHEVGLSGDQIAAAGPVADLPRADVEPTAVERNVELTGETDPYRLDFNDNPNLPIVQISSQAPTTKMAIALANAAARGLSTYVTNLQNRADVPARTRVVIRQTGPATGHVVDRGVAKKLALLVFVGVLFLWCVLMLVGARFIRTWRESAGVYAAREQRESSEAITSLQTPLVPGAVEDFPRAHQATSDADVGEGETPDRSRGARRRREREKHAQLVGSRDD